MRVERENDIQYSDEVYAFTETDVRDVGGRWLRERGAAALATGALRELRASGARPFTTRPRGARDGQNWDARRARALDPAIERWEAAAGYGPLTPQDLFDFVWLLAERAKPGKRRRRGSAGSALARSLRSAAKSRSGPVAPALAGGARKAGER